MSEHAVKASDPDCLREVMLENGTIIQEIDYKCQRILEELTGGGTPQEPAPTPDNIMMAAVIQRDNLKAVLKAVSVTLNALGGNRNQ